MPAAFRIVYRRAERRPRPRPPLAAPGTLTAPTLLRTRGVGSWGCDAASPRGPREASLVLTAVWWPSVRRRSGPALSCLAGVLSRCPVQRGRRSRVSGEPVGLAGATVIGMQPIAQREDPELLAAVAAGDLGAMRLLYERHAPWLSARLTRRCDSPEAVADDPGSAGVRSASALCAAASGQPRLVRQHSPKGRTDPCGDDPRHRGVPRCGCPMRREVVTSPPLTPSRSANPTAYPCFGSTADSSATSTARRSSRSLPEWAYASSARRSRGHGSDSTGPANWPRGLLDLVGSGAP